MRSRERRKTLSSVARSDAYQVRGLRGPSLGLKGKVAGSAYSRTVHAGARLQTLGVLLTTRATNAIDHLVGEMLQPGDYP
jgi:hypothetical protein